MTAVAVLANIKILFLPPKTYVALTCWLAGAGLFGWLSSLLDELHGDEEPTS